MKLYFIIGICVLLLLPALTIETSYACFSCNGEYGVNAVKVSALPELYVFERNGHKEGVSAAFGGVLEDAILVAGGCNFPGIPAADGGAKVYYNQIYVLRDPENPGAKWQEVGRLPVEVANGASVSLPEGVVCIGGCNVDGSFREVWLLKWDTERERVIVDTLPALPFAMDNMGAATDGKNIYVAGGNCNGKPLNRCFVLHGLESQTWEELPAFPGTARLQPVGVVQDGKFFLMGGFQPVWNGEESVLGSQGLVFSPITNQWSELSELIPQGEQESRALIGAAGVALNGGKIVFLGGVNREVFKRAVDMPVLQKRTEMEGRMTELAALKQEQAMYLKREVDWYHFNGQLLFYDSRKDTWTSVGEWPELARAGAVVVYYRGRLVVINGETKPGIRSTGVYRVDLGY